MKGALKGTAAIVNGQLSLDGTDGGYVLLGDYAALPPGGSATIVAWFRTASSRQILPGLRLRQRHAELPVFSPP